MAGANPREATEIIRLNGHRRSVDQAQERTRLADLPDKVLDLYEQKALLYLGIKQLNHLGRSVHAEDSGRSAAYSLDILYRRVRRQPPDAPPASPPDSSPSPA
jgi:hypothetical protein